MFTEKFWSMLYSIFGNYKYYFFKEQVIYIFQNVY